jgi:glycosyltransferase involved in cell wall biosynthesis
MPSPQVSICIPAYKAEKYLEATLHSVRDQTFTDWEIIVTEDGSKDRTEEIVKTFQETVSQTVIYNRHDINRGLPGTRNTGIATARGEWVAFLDSDDLWKPEHLAHLVAASKTGDYDVIYGGSQNFDDATGENLELRAPTEADLAEFPIALYTTRLIIQPSSAMIRRKAFERYGVISKEFPICNDLEFWLRVGSGGGQFKYSGHVTCLYRKHGNAMSLKSAALITETAQLCEKYSHWAAIPAAIRRSRPAELYRYAGQILFRKDPRGAKGLFRHSLRIKMNSPFTVAYWLAATLRSLIQPSSP